MKSLVVEHSVIVNNRKTSISLEEDFWQALHDIAKLRGVSVSHLITSIDADREFANLSSVIRLFVFRFFREQQDRRGLIFDVAKYLTAPTLVDWEAQAKADRQPTSPSR